ncbi:MAG: polysaccharide pyruvyl transferase CsaB [Candidatus Obscuribacterales bacterium]|nr:polysaccharide pyruvyl transferase CsaB [Candidatus Obscuribacterales bacterium]
MGRNLVVVSGYYGFDNLGDEAILEVIVRDLKRLVEPDEIVVLSQNPEETSATFGVKSVDRWNFGDIGTQFLNSRLFLSGGGGLYQDASSVKSVIYYTALAVLAYMRNVPQVVYAQGIGPLKSPISRLLTKVAMTSARAITIRDSASQQLLQSWNLKCTVTADPVWSLTPTALPSDVKSALAAVPKKAPLIGVSLRESAFLSEHDARNFARVVAEKLESGSVVVSLALQKQQDLALLSAFTEVLREKQITVLDIDTSALVRPSQWMELLSHFDFVIGMRFHALLMALKSAVPCLGLAYDPKVEYLMQLFDQPCLSLAKGDRESEFAELVDKVLSQRTELSKKAKKTAREQEELACQNFEVLARMLKKHDFPVKRDKVT